MSRSFEHAPSDHIEPQEIEELCTQLASPEDEVIYVDVPNENDPVTAGSVEGALSLMAMYHTLRAGKDVRFVGTNLVLRAKDTKEE